ncbi:hypothetical protein RCO48_05950 [Peribacillus frigoritolerans]|nr:hypothetical protein [Peribacillus frigoritolerans]
MEKEASKEAPSIVTYTIKVKTNMTTAEIADRLSKEKKSSMMLLNLKLT